MVMRLAMLASGLLLAQVSCRSGVQPREDAPNCVLTLDVDRLRDSSAPESAWEVVIGWGKLKDVNGRSSTVFRRKTIEGVECGGPVATGSGSTSRGRVEYRVEALATRMSEAGTAEIHISTTIPGKLQVDHAPGVTIIDVVSGRELTPPCLLKPGETHLRIKPVTVSSAPAPATRPD